MKKIILISCLFISTILNAQSPFEVDVIMNYGISKPIGEFASRNFNNQKAGYAQKGIMSDLSMDVKFGKKIGFAFTYLGQSNSFNTSSYYEQLTHTVNNATSLVDKYTIKGYMFGGLYSYPISPVFNIETKALFGFLNARSPQKYIEYKTNPKTWQRQGVDISNTFSFLLKVGVVYKVSRRVNINFLFSYLTSNPEFYNVLISDNINTSKKITFNQPFQTINTTIGIGIRLEKLSEDSKKNKVI